MSQPYNSLLALKEARLQLALQAIERERLFPSDARQLILTFLKERLATAVLASNLNAVARPNQ